MARWKMGPAPLTPEMPRIGELSKFPTHTPTVKSAVKPTHQLSRKSDEVPVLTAVRKGRLKGEWWPNAGERAALSERMSATR